MSNNLSLDNYRVGQSSLSFADEIPDNGTGAPFVNVTGPDPSQVGNNFDDYAQFHRGSGVEQQPGLTNTYVSSGAGPAHELVQVAIAYSRLNPSDLSHMLERIRLTNKMGELVPQLKAEAEEGRQAILVELGLAEAPKPKRNKKQPGVSGSPLTAV